MNCTSTTVGRYGKTNCTISIYFVSLYLNLKLYIFILSLRYGQIERGRHGVWNNKVQYCTPVVPVHGKV